jgi:hypothetical protein
MKSLVALPIDPFFALRSTGTMHPGEVAMFVSDIGPMESPYRPTPCFAIGTLRRRISPDRQENRGGRQGAEQQPLQEVVH